MATTTAMTPHRKTCVALYSVATGLWPVESKSSPFEGRLTEPWLQELHLAICAAKSKQSGGITGKILSTRFDGISDIAIRPPKLQQSSQKVPGDISRKSERNRQFRERRSTSATAIINTLHGANLCKRCGK